MTIATIIPSFTNNPPSRANPAAFPTDGDSFLNDLAGIVSAQNTVASELTTWNSEIETFKNQSAASKTNAESSKNNALTQARNAAASQVSLWVSGTTYAVNQMVYSSVDGRQYKRILAGAGTTDPSSDPTNWEPLGWEYITNYPDIRPTLDLNFAGSQAVDPRITFTRASTATYWDGKTFAKAEENLLSYSNNPGAAWTAISGGATLTSNAGVAPDGTNTATSVNVTNYGIRRSFNFTSGVQYTVSAYLRSVSGDTTFSADLQNAQTSPTFTLTSSWQRFTWTVTASAAHTWLDFQLAGAGVFEVWGVQLEQRSQATALTPTTDQPITKYQPVMQTAGVNQPRIDFDPVTGECKGLLIEEQRTNLLTYSEEFNNIAWSKVGGVIIANVVSSPDGAITSDSLAEDTSSGLHIVYRSTPLTSGTSYTLSFWVRRGVGNRNVSARLDDGASTKRSFINLTTGAVTPASGHTVTARTVGAFWYVTCTVTAAATASAVVGIELADGVSPTYTGDGTSGIYIWGAQLEAGSFPTSYIPTTTAQVTRAADSASMTGSNFTSWYRQDEGTFFAQASFMGATASSFHGLFSAQVDGNNRIGVYSLPSGGGLGFDVRYGSVQASASPVSGDTASVLNRFSRVGLAYANNDFAATRDGGAMTIDTAGSVPYVNILLIGRFDDIQNGHLRKLAYYPKRLPNATLQAITQP